MRRDVLRVVTMWLKNAYVFTSSHPEARMCRHFPCYELLSWEELLSPEAQLGCDNLASRPSHGAAHNQP